MIPPYTLAPSHSTSLHSETREVELHNSCRYRVLSALSWLALLFLLLGARHVQAQSPQWKWATQSTGSGTTQVKNIAVDAAGNTYVVGFFTETAQFGAVTLVSKGRSDLFVAKLSAAGHWEWALSTGGSESDAATGVIVDATGQVFVAGNFSTQANFGPTTLTSKGGMDIFVAQISAQGQWQGATAAGGAGPDRMCALTIGGAGDLLVAGQFTETASFGTTKVTSSGSTDAFVACLTHNRSWKWATSAGGSDNDEATALATNKAGEIYVTGYFSNTSMFGATSLTGRGMDDAFVGKLTNAGQWQWATAATGTNTAYGKSLVADPSGGVFVTGSFSGNATFGTTHLQSNRSDDGFVARLTSSGHWQWTNVLASDYFDNIAGIALDKMGNLYVAGTFSNTIQGGQFQLTSRGQQDVFAGYLSQDGTWLGLVGAGGTDGDEVQALALGPDGEVCISGTFSAAASFGTVSLLSATPAVQLYVSKAQVPQP
jgi:hypothetical protein